MTKTREELSKELSRIGNIEGWDKMITHVQQLMLETRLDELEQLHEIMDGDFSFAKEQRISELQSQLKALPCVKTTLNN